MRDIITSDRLTLRPFTLADAARVCELVGDFDVSKMLSRAPYPYKMEHATTWLDTHAGMRAAGTDYPYAITTAQDGVIGAIGLHATTRLADFASDAFEVGYWIGKQYWGLGYATEAGRALLDAFDADLTARPLVSGHFTENPQSGHVLEKLGFHYVGEPTTIFCVARQLEVPDRSMLRPAPTQTQTKTPDPERSPTP
jgi:RimJ/RimL family protein N-acetyltransferase